MIFFNVIFYNNLCISEDKILGRTIEHVKEWNAFEML